VVPPGVEEWRGLFYDTERGNSASQEFTMAVVELTFDQILEAARQLPRSQRAKLARSLESLPDPAQARAALRAMRSGHRLGAKKRNRLSELLLKGNAGNLNAAESEELDGLVDEFEGKTLDLARAGAQESSRRRGAGNQSTRR
jgi:ATP-dependent DNA ligase